MKSKINSVELILMRIDFCDLRIYIIIRMESWDNILLLHEINIENPLTVAKARNILTKFTHAGAVLIGADILLSGEIKPSHLINGAMLGVSTTGVGTIIAGVWFIADYGTMGINYIFTGEAKGISDMIDESIGTYELYEGIY